MWICNYDNNLPFYVIHNVYYEYFLYAKEQEKKSSEQKGAEAIAEMMDNQ